jgi:hypothetical protein
MARHLCGWWVSCVAHAAPSVSSCLGVSAAEGGDLAWDSSIETKSDCRTCRNRTAASVACEVSPLAVYCLTTAASLRTEALSHLLQDYQAQQKSQPEPSFASTGCRKHFIQFLRQYKTVRDPGRVSSCKRNERTTIQ